MNPLRYFLIPLVCLAGLAVLLTTQLGDAWSWTVVPPVLGIAVVYSLGPQIKWWYWGKYPPDLTTNFAGILDTFAFYRNLDAVGKREFRRRTFLLRENTNFIGQAIKTVPDDVQVMTAAAAATISFGRKNFLFDDFETVVFYKHLFPSPTHEVLHASEMYAPDGTLIFTLPRLAQSTLAPQQYLHLGLYEYARVYQHTYPGQQFPTLSWEQIATISRFSRPKVEEFIGLPDLDTSAIGLVLYFTHPDQFLRSEPELFSAIATGLKMS